MQLTSTYQYVNLNSKTLGVNKYQKKTMLPNLNKDTQLSYEFPKEIIISVIRVIYSQYSIHDYVKLTNRIE